jgi:hypothetical protein
MCLGLVFVQTLIVRLSLENSQLKQHVNALENEVHKLSETNQELGNVLRAIDVGVCLFAEDSAGVSLSFLPSLPWVLLLSSPGSLSLVVAVCLLYLVGGTSVSRLVCVWLLLERTWYHTYSAVDQSHSDHCPVCWSEVQQVTFGSRSHPARFAHHSVQSEECQTHETLAEAVGLELFCAIRPRFRRLETPRLSILHSGYHSQVSARHSQSGEHDR